MGTDPTAGMATGTGPGTAPKTDMDRPPWTD
jgi:hypothetical protein